jgi:hypothetical protein
VGVGGAATMRIAFVFLLACMVSACAGASQQMSPEPSAIVAAPAVTLSLADAKKSILAARNRMWKDPGSIRDASIGDVHSCVLDDLTTTGIAKRAGQCVCIVLNAKNSMGGYTGLRRTLFVFWNNGGMDTRDGAILGYEEYCSVTQPFPEMNAKIGRRR